MTEKYPKRIGKVSDKKRSFCGFFAAEGREGSGDYGPFMADVRPVLSLGLGKMQKSGFYAVKKRPPGRSDDQSVRLLADDQPRVGQFQVRPVYCRPKSGRRTSDVIAGEAILSLKDLHERIFLDTM